VSGVLQLSGLKDIWHRPEPQSLRGAVTHFLIVAVLVSACLFLLRLPAVLSHSELNPDESQMLSQGMKYLVDPVPWRAVDGTSSGPLNSYLISVFLLLGLKPGYVFAHTLATALVSLQVIAAYQTLAKLSSRAIAGWGILPMIFCYGFTQTGDYLEYSSELLPALLLALAFYGFAVSLDDETERPARSQLAILFLTGLALGATPWCKLQASPIAAAITLVALAATVSYKRNRAVLVSRWAQVAALCTGALIPTIILLGIVARAGVFRDFWNSYILANISYAGESSWPGYVIHFALASRQFEIRPLLMCGVLGAILFVGQLVITRSKDFASRHGWIFSVLLFFGSVLFAAFGSAWFLEHYAIFRIFSMPSFAALLLSIGAILFVGHLVLTRGTDLSSRDRWVLLALLLFFGSSLFVALRPALFFAHYTIFLIFPVSCLATLFLSRGLKLLPHKSLFYLGIAAKLGVFLVITRFALFQILSIEEGRRLPPWQDANQRIAAVVENVRKTHPVHSMAIWGWTPSAYVLTGIPPATRDSIGHFIITPGPLQPYFRHRFVSDLREKMPDLFVDSVAKGAFMWFWTESDGYESDEELRDFVDRNYVLVDQITLMPKAKPVRFFARRNILSGN
jgi:hypothetical protein